MGKPHTRDKRTLRVAVSLPCALDLTSAYNDTIKNMDDPCIALDTGAVRPLRQIRSTLQKAEGRNVIFSQISRPREIGPSKSGNIPAAVPVPEPVPTD